jgi:hypothetical protein
MEEVEDSGRFPAADYVVVLPLELDKYGMPTAESYRNRVDVRRKHKLFSLCCS